ncbi:alanine--tRNA ligase [Candidatus Nomurabacteria bacterium]|nr:alanine--tRNA ligase [Candidatus Nomurabacteria bacterium]
MDSKEIRQRFLEFFKARGHTIMSSSSLVPENDPSVLFTTAGMQQFKPYYTGEKNAQEDFSSSSATSVQKCVRTSDIEEVGDDTHLTFFEMLGNFSFGGYFKEEAIKYAYEFITQGVKLPISYVTVFEGKGSVPKDGESKKIWESLGVTDIREQGMEDVFWGPTGDSGPCGPTTEIYCRNKGGEDVEIWNIVFNEYFCDSNRENLLADKATLTALETKGIDTGMGLERLLTTVQGKTSIFETDLFSPIITKIEEFSNSGDTKAKRVVADHIRTAVFMIADGVTPSNTDSGYILRRLLRRSVRYADTLNFKPNSLFRLVETVIDKYGDVYENLKINKEKIKQEVEREENKFRETLKRGLQEFEKGADPFLLFTSYGFPLELIKELAVEKGLKIDEEKFAIEMEKHQETSRAGAGKKFKGGLADAGDEKVVQYHTATHLLHQALHDVLGDNVAQKGSNITSERLRFDFAHSQKLTDQEKQKIEEIVNQKIEEKLPVQTIVLPKVEAEKVGARMFFGDKYGDQVSVYFIGESLERAYSKEFCGGPHVGNTQDLKGVFKIVKEEAVASGVRRIKAVLE